MMMMIDDGRLQKVWVLVWWMILLLLQTSRATNFMCNNNKIIIDVDFGEFFTTTDVRGMGMGDFDDDRQAPIITSTIRAFLR